MNKSWILSVLVSLSSFLSGQNIEVEGYVFETNNRGYLNVVQIDIYSIDSQLIANTFTNSEGFFQVDLPVNTEFFLIAQKSLFKTLSKSFTTTNEDKLYLKLALERAPGYLLDITMAQKKDSVTHVVDALEDLKIEIYNNTRKSLELDLDHYPHMTFQHTLNQGNHYTFLIRKAGFLARRIEAYVNVNGCILCIDGVGTVTPGVADNLTQGFEMGTLLANVELEKISFDKSYRLENIYYGLNSAELTADSKVQLKNLIDVLKDNPSIVIELSAHTDSRGEDAYNSKLSQSRAESAGRYLIQDGDIEPTRIAARGYGETQLVNDCKNGVTCSESDHQKNRRTEFKIISDDGDSLIPLVEIKRLEQMEELIRELQNQEIVEVKEGNPIPADLATVIAAKAKSVADGDLVVKDVRKEGFTGFTIKYHVAKTEELNTDAKIPEEQPIWKEVINKELYYYYWGAFDQEEDARQLFERFAVDCAVCKIVEFKSGKIITKTQ